jgi:hypothetical protein
MQKIRVLLLCLIISPLVHSAEMVICVVNREVENNPTYYGLAITKSEMLCETTDGKKLKASLGRLHQQGWEISQVIGEGWLGYKTDKDYRSPVYYMKKN